MAVKAIIKTGEYYDSVSLMLVGRELTHLEGVEDASAMMATDANKTILREAGLWTAEIARASANDLVIVAKGEESLLAELLFKAESLLKRKQTSTSQTTSGGYIPRTIWTAKKFVTEANMAIISVAGRYAVDEAWEALKTGLHVLLFSDNVSLEDEVTLKTYASQHNLLLMGPGAGTAIINGVALGFANQLPSGPVGIVSAAGTGLQEVSTLLAKNGIGITQGIGVGGRDLKEEVGGLMMLQGLAALIEDASTNIIILISKPPSPKIIQKILTEAGKTQKAIIVCFLGIRLAQYDLPVNVRIVNTLEEAALVVVSMLKHENILDHASIQFQKTFAAITTSLTKALSPGQRYLRGLFSGGTLCYEAQVIWRDEYGLNVFSNAPLTTSQKLSDSWLSVGHTALDLGEEEFTIGRPHPMIDHEVRIRRILKEAEDPEVAVILLDVVLGYGAHPDPASELAKAIIKGRDIASREHRSLAFISSVTGTDADPQRLSHQVKQLGQAGVVVCSSNATAARLTAGIVRYE